MGIPWGSWPTLPPPPNPIARPDTMSDNPPMGRYAFATMAVAMRTAPDGEVQSATRLEVVEAMSDDEAFGKAMRRFQEQTPREDGWLGHKVTVRGPICHAEFVLDTGREEDGQ